MDSDQVSDVTVRVSPHMMAHLREMSDVTGRTVEELLARMIARVSKVACGTCLAFYYERPGSTRP